MLNMPIVVNSCDIQWYETDSILTIVVPLKGVTKNNASIFSSSRYLKISQPPYICEIFLEAEVDSNLSSAKIGDNKVNFQLVKKEKGLWSRLSSSESENPDYCDHQRKQALEEIEKNTNDSILKRNETKHESGRYSVQMQMELEGKERKRIEEIKESERQRLRNELNEWTGTGNVKYLCSEQNCEKQEGIDKVNKYEAENEKNTVKKFNQKSSDVSEKMQVCPEKKKLLSSLKTPIVQNKKSLIKIVPPPRSSGQITVSFTPRVFPTAMRESQQAEEEEWLQKQASARKSLEIDCSDLKPEERNPQWLKEKGDDFFAKQDYLSAVNAYNLAIRMCPNMYSLYSNRSACHLQLNNLHKALEDTSKALELLTPCVESNADARLKCHVRRGTAFCKLELYVEGLQDYEAALRISPNDSSLRADANKIRLHVQSSCS